MSASLRPLAPALAALLTVGCATTPAEPQAPRDPLEGFNRAVYRFNDAFDRHLLKPVAETYQRVTPAPVNRGVSNFFGNLEDVVILFNDVLQFKLRDAASDLGRITFNTTVGLCGVLDVATPMNFAKHDEDFGQTLGYWGVEPGPYLVLPFLGPSSVRDGVGRLADGQIYPVYRIEDEGTRWALIGLEAVDTRADLLRATKLVEQAALDPYAFTRDAYLQRRRSQVHDGNPPEPELDPFADELFGPDSDTR